MPIGIKAQDFTTADGLRNVTITRMDGKPIDLDAWAAELKVPEIDMREIGPVTWDDETIPGTKHALFTWWVRTPAFRLASQQQGFTPHLASPQGERDQYGGVNG